MGSKLPGSHTIAVESSTSVIAQVCEQILAEIKANSYTAEDVFAIHLAFEEAFTNAVKHGNKMDPKKHVQVDYSVDHEKVEISYNGRGRTVSTPVKSRTREAARISTSPKVEACSSSARIWTSSNTASEATASGWCDTRKNRP